MAFRQFTPTEWTDEIDSGLDFRKKFGVEGTWGELEAMYYNVHKSMANDGPNIIMSTMDSLLSSLTVPTPAIMVKPETPEAVQRAPLVETLDNILLREMGVREEVDTAALHAGLMGCGIIKIGFDSEYGYDPKQDVGGALKMGFTLTQFGREGKRRIESDSGVAPGMPWIRAVDPRDIIVPWGTLRLTNCPWIAHRFVRQIDDLKSDPKYHNTQRLEPSLSMEDFVQSYTSTIRIWQPSSGIASNQGRQSRSSRRYMFTKRGSREVQYVELFEIHDRRTGRILCVAPGHSSFLRDDFNALQIDNVLPFAAVSFTPKSRSFWTTSDAYYLQAGQMEISDLAVQRTKIRRIAVVKFLYDSDIIDDDELEKLLSPDVGAAAAIKSGGDIQKAIMPLQTHPDQTLILEEEHIRKNLREQIGFSRNQLGEFSGGRRTATEARVVDRSASRRLSRRGLAVKRLYESVISIVNGIVFQHWTTPRYIEVLGEQQAQTWQKITGPQLKSRYSYDVEFTDDEEVRARRREGMELYLLLIQDPSIDPIALRQYIADQFNDPGFARLFNADIQRAMQAMRIAGGVVQPETLQPGGPGQAAGRPTGGAGSPSVLSTPNGQGAQQASQGVSQLASRRPTS
jgi:hypothetical protein